MSFPCDTCGADRVRRWEAMRKANGLTEAEWPKPSPPEFRNRAELALHRVVRHRTR